ncbi:MAG: hypothetical protein GY714_01670 [Desulfobacterales bacterium]|nr:hypothetical protein [Desulfobacterales bacterium]
MATSHDNFYVTTLIDRSTGESARVKNIVNTVATRLGFTETTDTDTVGDATLYAFTTTGGATLTTSDTLIAKGTPEAPFVFSVKDEGGDASSDNLIVDGGTATIDGGADITISTDYGSVTLYSDGTNLFSIVV